MKFKVLICVFLLLIFKPLSAQQRENFTNLNLASAFYGMWEGKIKCAAYNAEQKFNLNISSYKKNNDSVLIAFIKEKAAISPFDSVLIPVKNGVIEIPVNLNILTGSQDCLASNILISLLDTNVLIGVQETSVFPSCAAIEYYATKIPVYGSKKNEQSNSLKEVQDEEKRSEFSESEAIRQCAAGKVFRKSESILEIKLTNGKTTLLKNEHDQQQGDEQLVAYTFEECLLEMNMYLFGVSGWEWSNYLLVSMQDGEKYYLYYNKPILSPDKRKLITYQLDNGYNTDESFIAIYAYKNNKLVKEYQISPKDWGPIDIQWIDNNTLRVETGTAGDIETKKTGVRTISFKNSKWVLSAISK